MNGISKPREGRQTVESIDRDNDMGDRIADDMWLAEVADQLKEMTDMLKQANDEAEGK